VTPSHHLQTMQNNTGVGSWLLLLLLTDPVSSAGTTRGFDRFPAIFLNLLTAEIAGLLALGGCHSTCAAQRLQLMNNITIYT